MAILLPGKTFNSTEAPVSQLRRVQSMMVEIRLLAYNYRNYLALNASYHYYI